ncbi:MAG: T9SS type A sorting domain-containing protein [Bacteroidia bacterium]|nr:T9SS type A sorting domain-containing protein [Bacteroidia bacterium]
MRNLFLFFSFIFSLGIFCQSTTSPEVIASSGDYNSGPSASLSWTLGEIVTETVGNGANTLTQGFQQPFLQNTTGIINLSTQAVSVFPNPVSDELFITLPKESEFSVFIIKDLSGKEIHTEKIMPGFILQKVEMQNYTAGIYFIQILSSTGKSNSIFKIIKQ